MLNAFYSILVILVALASIARGFRFGLSRQIASVLGFAFGAVCARVLTPQFTPNFLWAKNFSQAPEFADFTVNLVSAVVIYIIVFFLFSFLSPLFNKVMRVLETGILNRIIGAFFSLIKNLLWVSIFLNLLLCLSPKSKLLNYEQSNDGNLVATVMDLTPAILGCYGASDFAHFNQLKEAKSISQNCNVTLFPDSSSSLGNFKSHKDVIFTKSSFQFYYLKC